MRRLYQKIYLTIVATLLLVVLVSSAFWRMGAEIGPASVALDLASELASAALPPADASVDTQQRALERLARRVPADFALFDRSLNPIGYVGPPPPPAPPRPGFHGGPHGMVWAFRLQDQRLLMVHPRLPRTHPALGIILILGSIALVIALVAFPVVRGLTRRLERLQTGVEKLGAGDLAARVEVEGRDEVAQLAESFNRAASRIEELVAAHRLLLANTSHELRTPLARIRLGLELYEKNSDPKYKAQLTRDISELDFMLDEILLVSRLEANPKPQAPEEVDLLALAAEECARYENCALDGIPVMLRGDPRLLRRMIRNLLENAVHHGKPPVRVDLRRDSGKVVLDVIDAGSGVPEQAREKIFTPFYKLGNDGNGAGLGLALVRQIARVHGGDAMVVARPDATSCFRVTLPINA